MKTFIITALLITTCAAFAAKPDAKKNKPDREAMRAMTETLKSLDKNGNHQIEGAELEALRSQFASQPKGALAKIDHNANGKLDDDEISKMNKRLSAPSLKKGETAKKPSKSEAKPADKTVPADPLKPREGETVLKAEVVTR